MVDPVATKVIYMIVYASTPGKNYIVKSTDLGALRGTKFRCPSRGVTLVPVLPDGTPAVWIATDRQQTGVLYAVGGH